MPTPLTPEQQAKVDAFKGTDTTTRVANAGTARQAQAANTPTTSSPPLAGSEQGTGTGVPRDTAKEAATIASLGFTPQNDADKRQMILATYGTNVPDEFKDLMAQATDLQGTTDQNALSQFGKDVGQAGLAATDWRSKLEEEAGQIPGSLSTLQTALRMKSDVGNASLGTSDIFKQAGVGGYGALSASLASHLNEMNAKYDSFANVVQQAGQSLYASNKADLAKAQNALDQYKVLTDSYQYEQGRLDDLAKTKSQYEHDFATMQMQFENSKALADYQNGLKKDLTTWENDYENLSPEQQVDYRTKQKALWDSEGYTPGYMADPANVKYGVTYSQDGSMNLNMVASIRADGVALDASGNPIHAGQCGHFGNDMGFVTADGQRMFGDTYQDKYKWVDPSIKIPEPGMAAVMETNSSAGHVMYVKSVDYANGKMTVYDSNWSSKDDELLRERTVDISTVFDNGGGFVRPPSATSVDAPVLSSLDEKKVDDIRSVASQFRQEPIVKDYNIIQGQYQNISKLADQGVGGPGDVAMIYDFMKALDPTSVVRSEEYAAAAQSGNIFQGAMARFNGYFKDTGGILPDNVKQAFKDVVNTKLTVSTQQYQNLYDEYTNQVNSLAGGKNVAPEVLTDYSKAFSVTDQSSETDPDEELYNSLQTYNDPDYQEGLNIVSGQHGASGKW